jgi:uncharacterized lipoprotein YddW (UPF0748 family)
MHPSPLLPSRAPRRPPASRPLAGLLAGLLVLGFAPPAQASVPPATEVLRDRIPPLQEHLAAARQRLLDAPLDGAEDQLGLARGALDTASMLEALGRPVNRSQPWRVEARRRLDLAYAMAMPSPVAETRGLYLDGDAIPRTREGVQRLVARLADAGFNMLLPEAFRRGYALFRTPRAPLDPSFEQAPEVLEWLADEAHARGMEVHPWIWTFRVQSPGFGNPVLSPLPGLAARQDGGQNARFLSPGDPAARAWVFGLVDDLASRVELDGLMLDYVRYDEETPSDWTSWTRWSLDWLARKGKLPPARPETGTPEWIDYQLWREAQVHRTVAGIRARLQRRDPGLRLGVATFRGERYGRLNKLQHWRHWADQGWIDYDASMLYTARTSDLETWLDWETDEGRRPGLLFPILGPLRMTEPVQQTLEQIAFVRSRHQQGVLFFSLSHLDDDLLEALRLGPFRRRAYPVHRHPVRASRRLLSDLASGYLRGLQIHAPALQAATAAGLRRDVESLARSLPLAETPYLLTEALLTRLENLDGATRDPDLSASVSEELRTRLADVRSLWRAHAHATTRTRPTASTQPPMPPAVRETERRD